MYYDAVLERFTAAGARIVTRSGCYVTHDSGLYKERHEALARRLGETDGLRPALEVWTYVQSCPEPTLALLTAGRRDLGSDAGYPVPLLASRDGAAAQPIDPGCAVFAMNDQHAYLRLPAGADVRVGDRIGLGISHPCTTFDKWSVLFLVDDDHTVVDALKTCF